MINRIRDALGWLTGSALAVLIIAALVTLPFWLVLWLGMALGVREATGMHTRVMIWISDAFDAANGLLPAWAWFAVIACAWLAFLDVHVRWLVRDELAKHTNERSAK